MEKYNREIVIDDKALVTLVEEKGAIVEEGRGLAERMGELAKEHEQLLAKQNQLISKANKVKIDIVRKCEKLVGDQLTEFEVPVTTNLKDGKVVFVCADTKAEWEEAFKEINKWQSARVPTKKSK